MILGVHAYLKMNGNGKEAVKFYEEVLEAEVLSVQTYGELPENPEFPLPEEGKNRIVHANLRIGNTFLMLSDIFPGESYEKGSQVDVAILLNNVEQKKCLANLRKRAKQLCQFKKHLGVLHTDK